MGPYYFIDSKRIQSRGDNRIIHHINGLWGPTVASQVFFYHSPLSLFERKVDSTTPTCMVQIYLYGTNPYIYPFKDIPLRVKPLGFKATKC